jgi:hypothetical protein
MDVSEGYQAAKKLSRHLNELAETQPWMHDVADLSSGEVLTFQLDRPVTSISRAERLSRLGHHLDEFDFPGPKYKLTPRYPYHLTRGLARQLVALSRGCIQCFYGRNRMRGLATRSRAAKRWSNLRLYRDARRALSCAHFAVRPFLAGGIGESLGECWPRPPPSRDLVPDRRHPCRTHDRSLVRPQPPQL